MTLPYRTRRKHRHLPWPASRITADLYALRLLARYRGVPVSRLVESMIHAALSASIAELASADEADEMAAQAMGAEHRGTATRAAVKSNRRAAESHSNYRV